MRESLGIVETVGISTAIEVADVMVKAANVKILELENSRGSGYMTVKVVGDVGAAKAAVSAAKAEGMKCGNLVSASVIARPSDGMASLFCNPKVPYQSVNKKPIPQAWEDEKPKKKEEVKKDEPKKPTAKKAEPAKKASPAKAKAPSKTEAQKVSPKKEEPKKVEPKKAEVKKEEPVKAEPKKVEVKKEEPKKVEAKKPEPKKEAPKTDAKSKSKTSSPKSKK